jgi:broad specificity phosphatase PhoE
MHTDLFLVRNGSTEWSRERRVAGRRDLALSAEGQAQAADVGERMRSVEIAEVLTSPVLRAVETSERIAKPHGLEVARDPRLTDLGAGTWEGMKHDEVGTSDAYKRFLANPLSESIPGGEKLTDARDRLVSSVNQALVDNELGASVVMVSHAGPLRVMLAHYLGMDLANYHRIRLSPASITVLRFDSERGIPRLLLLNFTGVLDGALKK